MSGWFRAGEVALFPSRYLGTVGYYAALSAYKQVVIDSEARFDKRAKAVHRCRIADTHGEIQLTVPIEKPVSLTGAQWKDILISGHGNWWHVHWETLQSAYGRTPFFEYYADDFAWLFSSDAVGLPVLEFNARLDHVLRALLGIETEVNYTADEASGRYVDFRRRVPEADNEIPYYQVRASRYGFMPDLSVIDLLFNVGPESPLVLTQISRRLFWR